MDALLPAVLLLIGYAKAGWIGVLCAVMWALTAGLVWVRRWPESFHDNVSQRVWRWQIHYRRGWHPAIGLHRTDPLHAHPGGVRTPGHRRPLDPGDVGSAEAALEVLDAAVDEAVATRPGPAEEVDGETTLGQTLTGNSAGDGLLQGIFPLAVSQSFQITGELWDAFLRAVRLSAREALAIMGTLF